MVELLAVKADLGVWEDARSFIERTVSEYGRVDVLINNAGWGVRVADFDDLTIDEIREGMDINLMSVLFCCMPSRASPGPC